MTTEEKRILGFLAAIRTENNSIGQELAKIIEIVGNIRASELGIDLIISKLEDLLKK